ncbi:uncharacterized protein TRUGW13939_02038 [Talaromyces rugulosus]|uniref:Xylanolytic transcriptional activator regulatory domain-containing protein n=1 Tax=Talaromyces rugulosus TaxID=121627 RepID=A0A7H8QM67_TALRU|nr:uncharacterized protein TRUGW13939_02038 [Talaromyces rugulosus]QKX54948.1 hypothetical protein TRUGW13939_02038 [Talaromyces rugulosus]
MVLLQRLFPGRTLDLETLKEISSTLQYTKPEYSTAGLAINSDRQSSSADRDLETDRITSMHNQLGCLMVDSRGAHRYTGANSGASFNAAVRDMKEGGVGFSGEHIITPLKQSSLPPPTPDIVSSVSSEPPYLPPKALCNHYVARFLSNIQSVYWFYSLEQFHIRLEETLSTSGILARASWLCSLYSIFAMGSATNIKSSDIDSTWNLPIDAKTCNDYLLMAKRLVPEVCDEADIETVRALALLGLALSSACYKVSSYLYIGTAVRTANTLGLHRNVFPSSDSELSRECARRLWWTLYMLDQATAQMDGRPPAIADQDMSPEIPLPSEELFNIGTHTPVGYLALAVSLSKLAKAISLDLYTTPSFQSRKISLRRVFQLISSLQEWYADVPAHLKCNVPLAPSHRRPVAILHLQYWACVILVSRPFLLYTALYSSQLNNSELRSQFEELSKICLDAAENSVAVIKSARDTNFPSSVLYLDTHLILEIVQIMFLAYIRSSNPTYRSNIQYCFAVLQDMDPVGCCKYTLLEVTAQLTKSGIVVNHNGDAATNMTDADVFDTVLPSVDFDLLVDTFRPSNTSETDLFSFSDFMIQNLGGSYESFSPDLG